MVKSLVAEDSIHAKYYNKAIENSEKDKLSKLLVSLLLGISQFGQFLIFGTVFLAFAYWQRKYNIDVKDFFTSVFSLFFGVYGAGMANQFLGDIGAAQASKEK